MSDNQLETITRSMTYTIPQLGDNVLKHAKLLWVCGNIGCANKLFVSQKYMDGKVDYSCPVHGKRKRNQRIWLDITGSTMLEFRKVGL